VDTPTKLTKQQQDLLKAFQAEQPKKHKLW